MKVKKLNMFTWEAEIGRLWFKASWAKTSDPVSKIN
jgi:hypothetical protein